MLGLLQLVSHPSEDITWIGMDFAVTCATFYVEALHFILERSLFTTVGCPDWEKSLPGTGKKLLCICREIGSLKGGIIQNSLICRINSGSPSFAFLR